APVRPRHHRAPPLPPPSKPQCCPRLASPDGGQTAPGARSTTAYPITPPRSGRRPPPRARPAPPRTQPSLSFSSAASGSSRPRISRCSRDTQNHAFQQPINSPATISISVQEQRLGQRISIQSPKSTPSTRGTALDQPTKH